MIIRFQGKDLNLRLTYKSIHFLELAFDQDYASFIAEQTPFNQSLYIFWAMLQNEADYEGVSVLDVAELLQDSLDSYEFTLEEYFDKVNSSYASSILVKQLFKNNTSSLPRGGGRRGRASEARRKILYGIVYRLRNTFQRLLDKYTV